MKHSLSKDNKKVHYEVTGEGNAVVFLHGFLESSQMWKDFSEEYSSHYKVICIDLPGFGKSDVFTEVHSMEFMAEVVKNILEEQEVRECVMIGHSMGGYVSLAFLEKYPELLKGLVLFHSHALADTEEAKINRNRTINIVDKNKKNFISQFVADLFTPSNRSLYKEEIQKLVEVSQQTKKEGIIAALKGMKKRTAKLKMLSETNIPVKFILGKEDPRMPLQNILAQTILPKYTEAVILSGVGHMGFIEAKEKTMQTIKCFVKNCYADKN